MDRHPCFNKAAHGRWGRLHLPVAPTCNIQCNYCDRRYNCANESRPGVCSRLVQPEEVASLLKQTLGKRPEIAVVGIAGPGDPLATPETTLTVLETVRRLYPGLLLCLSTNGLVLANHVNDLKDIGVRHVTVTINASTAETAQRIYSRVNAEDGSAVPTEGLEAAGRLLESQTAALQALRQHAMTTKVNTVLIPGVNTHEVENIAKLAARHQAFVMNCIEMIPSPGTPLGEALAHALPLARSAREALIQRAGLHISQMRHCTRCRADAVGLLHESRGLFAEYSSTPRVGESCMGV